MTTGVTRNIEKRYEIDTLDGQCIIVVETEMNNFIWPGSTGHFGSDELRDIADTLDDIDFIRGQKIAGEA